MNNETHTLEIPVSQARKTFGRARNLTIIRTDVFEAMRKLLNEEQLDELRKTYNTPQILPVVLGK